ncbi:hypothetical protein RUM43_012305 [Polyplax serrata]|uniref:Uncharacterized protein n=1 Tax=Polyplax serrata TaxID=468196 RepID=A0AAN8P3H9_POLSC
MDALYAYNKHAYIFACIIHVYHGIYCDTGLHAGIQGVRKIRGRQRKNGKKNQKRQAKREEAKSIVNTIGALRSLLGSQVKPETQDSYPEYSNEDNRPPEMEDGNTVNHCYEVMCTTTSGRSKLQHSHKNTSKFQG